MIRIYNEHKQTHTVIFLERHVSGKYLVKFAAGTYSHEKVRYKREPEAVIELEYNPRIGSIEIIEASFSFNLVHVSEDFPSF